MAPAAKKNEKNESVKPDRDRRETRNYPTYIAVKVN